MAYILFDPATDKALALYHGDWATAQPAGDCLALWCTDDANVNDHEHWAAVAADPEQHGPPLEVLREMKRQEAIRQANRLGAVLTAKYSDIEEKSRQEQEVDALALTANPAAPAEFLRGLAAVRGVDVHDLATRVLRNVAEIAQVTPYILGQQQRFEDLIAVAQTKEELEAIEIVFTLPDPPEKSQDAGHAAGEEDTEPEEGS